MKLQPDFVYIACPYSHPNPLVRQRRYKAVTKAAAHLLAQGLIVYSPITHSHPMAMRADLPDWEFWQKYDETFLLHSRMMVVLAIHGWEESRGVRAEMAFAALHSIPTFLLEPETYIIGGEIA